MSDTTDLGIIVILLVILYLYVSYVKKLIESKYDIYNSKCSPVNLFLKSINSESSEGINNFADCVQLLNPST